MSQKFCRFCGQPLRNPAARFCPSCGQDLSGSLSAPLKEDIRPYLIMRAMGEAPTEVRLSRTNISIGRMPTSDIVLPQSYVSGNHGRLEFKDPAWIYTDLDSTNGTYINGERQTQVALHDGDILRIGDPQGNSVSLTFRLPSDGKDTLLHGQAHLGGTALGDQQAQSFSIGRNPQADLPLEAAVVSWNHARLDHTTRGDILTDLNSTNGTFVNGQRIRQPVPLKQGDVVQIGPFKLIKDAHGLQRYGATSGVRVDGVKLDREVGPNNKRRKILSEVNVSIYPREFVALVGGSGAGKSTLLKALNGFTRADGEVLINGDNLYQHFDLYRTLIGYVPQDDIIHKELTVENALRYAARLRLPPDTSEKEVEERVAKVLRQVQMESQREQVIGNLSGGQRKRVSIAVELLADPRLFFLDEPTSGLDPGLDKQMMKTLRDLADNGRTVILVTHATANITFCDHVCFMAQGRMVYFGPPKEASKFFGIESDDFADIYAILNAPDPQKSARQVAEEWEARFRQSPYYEKYVADRLESRPAVAAVGPAETAQMPRVNPLRQFAVLTRRYVDLVLRDRLLLTILLSIMPILGLLLLIISKPNWLVGDSERVIAQQLAADLAAGKNTASYYIVTQSQTLLFMMGLASVLLGVFASAYEIVKEQAIYQRERMVTLRLVPYLLSKVLVLSAFALIQCLLLLIVVGLKVEYPFDGVILPALLEMYITLVLGALVSIMMGLFISSLVPNSNSVIYLILFLLFFQIIFAGVIFELPGPAGQLSRLTQTRWVIESLGISADLEGLNRLSRNEFQSDPLTQEVSTEVEQPDPDWKPVTIITETKTIPVEVRGVTEMAEVPVPTIIENPIETVTKTVSREITFTPDPITVRSPARFQLDYTRTPEHLIRNWLILIGFGLFFTGGTLLSLRQKDIK